MIDEYRSELVKFVGEEFLSESERADLDAETPLLEAGILDSLRVAVLLNFIREELGVNVPLARLDMRNFADIATLAAMLADLAPVRSGGAA
ncbi:acyl carrier protein [Saccharopolyspora shandongensis]|uniref:Clorobiocin biosynthesis protein CloN5 n=1 Tax=Saccharopolyspora shandongensis TaxID=418495 RepID=A0A1H3BGB3_9PSEU|nr:acyl carrier protein [Saccharopolyspora shandongensis]SDX40414.1 clorobiocin biosynthesis protein CloN5 [Saccharopolyspora shandongensis]